MDKKTFAPAPVYERHDGTMNICGATNPGKAAGRAFRYIHADKSHHIDFFCIGANANQQAAKAMGLLKAFIEEDSDMKMTGTFCPLHVRTETTDPTTQEKTMKDATAWRLVIVDRSLII
jgi:stage V sporulation protein SpoVS